jgi:hypothetical protein
MTFEAPLPSSVKRQVEKSVAMIQERKEGNTAPPAAVSAPTPAPAAPQPIDVPAPPAPAQPPAQAPQPQRDDQQVQQLQNKLNVLQGKYDAEVPRLNQANRELNDQLRAVRDENEQLRQQAQATPIPNLDEVKSFFADEISPEYADKLEAMIRAAVNPLAQEVGTVKKTAADQAEEKFWGAVNAAHADWQQVNERWKAWLVTVSPTGELWDHALQRGMQARDAQTVNRILQSYKDHEAAASGHKGPGPTILPGNSGGGGNPAPEKRTYRQSEIRAFYDEKTKLSRGQQCLYTAAQADALEQDIYRAQNEGRVIPG